MSHALCMNVCTLRSYCKNWYNILQCQAIVCSFNSSVTVQQYCYSYMCGGAWLTTLYRRHSYWICYVRGGMFRHTCTSCPCSSQSSLPYIIYRVTLYSVKDIRVHKLYVYTSPFLYTKWSCMNTRLQGYNFM